MKLSGVLVDRRPLQIPAFRRLWTASVVTAVGGSFGVVAVPTQVFTLTGSSAAVGAAAAVSLGALVASALWAGVMADVTDRRRLSVVGNSVLVLAYLGLWSATALGLDALPVLLALVALQGAGFGVTMTVTGAVVPRVVPAERLVAANSLSALARYTGAVVGPLLAGVLIPVLGLDALYLFDAAELGVVLWAVARLPAMPPLSGGARRIGPVAALRGLGGGVRHLFGRRVLVAVLAVDLAAMVFAMPGALFPELAERAFGGPPGGGPALGLMFAAYPAGVLLAGVLSGPLRRARRHGALMATAALLWGGCVVLLGLAPDIAAAVVALVAGGAVNFGLSTFRNTITQADTVDGLRGRIQGLLTVVLMGGPQLANVLHGVAGALVGARWAIGIGGLLTVVSVAVLLRLVPELWRYEPRPSPQP